MKQDTVLFASFFEGIRVQYPNLHPDPGSAENTLVLRGKFPINHNGREIDRFFIKVEIRRDFPRTWPRVWETRGRIPHTAERHVNLLDGTLCVVLPDEAYLRYPQTMAVVDYFNGPLRNFFVGQLCIERGDPWPWGEHAHGAEGAIAYYAELLGIADPLVISRVLLTVCEHRYKGHWPCPCGSGEIIRKCHGPTMRLIGERVPTNHLLVTLRSIVDTVRREDTT